MTNFSVSVSATQVQTMLDMSVTADYAATGDEISSNVATERLEIINLRSNQWAIEYRIGSGEWQVVQAGKVGYLIADLSTQTVRIRRSKNAPSKIVVNLVLYSKPTGLKAGQSEIDILSAVQIAALRAGNIIADDGALYGLAETTPYVTVTGITSGTTTFTGACELAGWYCSVAAGNITIYDATSVTGTPIVPATALVAGPMPIFGAGTTGKLALTTGCHVVLSGAATVRVMVA
jgi:hypothetical protein